MPEGKRRVMFQVSETSFAPPTSGRLLELATLLIRVSALVTGYKPFLVSFTLLVESYTKPVVTLTSLFQV